ncbi:MAG: hypothetical protein ACRD4G_19285 [Bryobacteraceae bacterium]
MGVAVMELMYPHLDPHNLGFLFLLTLYSGFTQPVLAHSGAANEAKMEKLERQLDDHMTVVQLQLDTLLEATRKD